MPTFHITAPDGTAYEVNGPEGSTEHQALQQVMAQHQAAPAQPTGEQPSVIDRIVASPIGRGIHDIGGSIISGIKNVEGAIPFMGGDQAAFQTMRAAVNKPYEASLARNRNTPGYAAARQQEDARLASTGGAGLSDQVLPSIHPTVSGLAGLVTGGTLDASNAAADAQAAGQETYQAANPRASNVAHIVGGLMAGPETGLPKLAPAIPKQAVPTIADLKAAARVGYKRVDNAGVQISSDAMNGVADSIADKFGGQVDPILYPKTTAAFNRVLQYGTDGAKGAKPATFTDLDNLRRVVGAATKSADTADAGLAGEIMRHLDNFTDNLSAAHLDTTLQDELRANLVSATSQKGQVAKQIKSIEQNKPGALAARGAAGADTRAAYMDLHEQLPAAEEARLAALGDFKSQTDLINAGPQETIDTLKTARGLWSRAKQTETLSGVIDDAMLTAGKGANPEQALRNGFASLAKNDKQMAKLSPEVQKQVRAVVMGGPTANILKYVGKLAPRGIVSTALSTGMGGAIGGIPGAMVLPMVGEAARMGSVAATRAAAQRAADLAALGRTATALPRTAPFNLPNLPARGALPYGGLQPSLPRLMPSRQNQ